MPRIHEHAGRPATETDPPHELIDPAALAQAYFEKKPDPAVPGQRVSFGTSGHRGSSEALSFNEDHIAAICQAICDYRREQGIDGPLYTGFDTHALSEPAFKTALEVLAGNGVTVLVDDRDRPTPTPVISHAILTHNRGRRSGLADGIVITPSHNPPESGGFKYNPPHGGPAEDRATGEIQQAANAYLEARLNGVKRVPLDRARRAPTTRAHDYLRSYVRDLASVVKLEKVREAGPRLAVDPLGGAGLDYWEHIREVYRLDLTVTRPYVDPTFKFMTLDWDGKIRMDPSSRYAMAGLLEQRGTFDIAFACDPDHDRHGIVTAAGLMPANDYLVACTDYLFSTRERWQRTSGAGRTVVTSRVIDRVAEKHGRDVTEVPVGFKWFVDGLLAGDLGIGCEESAGTSFLREDGTVWTTDKDGITACLLAAEILAVSKNDPAAYYAQVVDELKVRPAYDRLDYEATPDQVAKLKALTQESAAGVRELGGEAVKQVLVAAAGNGRPFGGLKVMTENAWFAVRPSGTEPVYKLYVESLNGEAHLRRVRDEAEDIVSRLV